MSYSPLSLCYKAAGAAIILAVTLLVGCSPTPDHDAATEAALDWRSIPKIDIHGHYNYPRDYLVPLLDEWNMTVLNVEVVTDPARPRWPLMVEHSRLHPDHFILAPSFDASRIDEPDFAENVVAQLRENVSQGAKMVKVWKNIGLVYTDNAGSFIQIDDPRFQPIWDYLTEAGIPVLAHIGEPWAAWLALDERSPHHDYYSNHPQYHFYTDLAAVPSWETVIEARDRWLERNPRLVVVGAHLGSTEHDTDAVAERLDRFPNFSVELAERFGDLAIQPSEKVRDFFIRYQDRILYGTDLGTRRPQSDLTAEQLQEEKEDFIVQRWQVNWDYFTRTDTVEYVRTGTPFRVKTKGLGLPVEVLEKVYYRNAARVLGLEFR